MTERDELTAAFDGALRQVDRAHGAGMRTRTGEAAAPRLERLRAELLAERASALERGSADRDRIGAIVRSVAEWTPEDELALLAALGRIARRSSGG